MLQHLQNKTEQKEKLAEAIISTLAFFSLYNLPLNNLRVHELLLGLTATQSEVDEMLIRLSQQDRVVREANLFGLKKWNQAQHNLNQLELTKKWERIDRHFYWLAMLPFVRQISVINSLALGTADSDSDIDFFVVTKPNRLYFVRSIIIVLFRVLKLYKTRQRIKDRFCFGFFVSQDKLSLHHLLLQPEDPYLVFWQASLRPILGKFEYELFMYENSWIKTYFPNLDISSRHTTIKQPRIIIRIIKFILEILLWLPATILEPFLAKIHINHTFKLAENKTKNSTTIANRDILKLHGHDVRAEVAFRYQEILEKIKKDQ